MSRVVANKYRIETEIGRGGMGVVYRAHHVSTGAGVALKMLLRATDAKARARFEREMELTSRLRHPNSVRVLDAGHTEEDAPFLVCELLHGHTLADALAREGRLSTERAVRIALQILDALEEAHGLGIVHRDIKPQNVFLCPHLGPDFVKVLDFGIAKRPDSSTMTPLTTAGNAVGTLRYMAPEQLDGKEVSPATDLYALGLVLAEMVHGAPLVTGQTPQTMFMMQLSPLPVPVPAHVANTTIGPVVMRAVQKELGLRFSTAAEMRHALLLATGSFRIGAPPKRDLRPATIAIAAGMAFIFTVVVVWVSILAARPAKPGDDDDAREATSKPKPSGPSKGLIKASLRDITEAGIEKAIQRAGFTASQDSIVPGARIWNMSRKGEFVGQVKYFPSDPVSAELMATDCDEWKGTYAKDDGRLLCVWFEEDKGEERALFDAIVR